jgi:hypothetical protein
VDLLILHQDLRLWEELELQLLFQDLLPHMQEAVVVEITQVVLLLKVDQVVEVLVV